MKNYRGHGSTKREVVTAAAARTSGQAVVENGFIGVAEVDAALNARYVIRRDGEFEFATGSGQGTGLAAGAKGDVVFINRSTFALTRAAAGTAPGAGLSVFGRITATSTDSNTKAAAAEPKAGFVWVSLEPQEGFTA